MTPVELPGGTARRSIRAIVLAALPLLLGFVLFLCWSGSHVLMPTRIGWVMMGLDTPSHYLSWQFFRHTPWLQWPLGANPAYGSDAPNSIVFADTIPLFAFFFKLFSVWLPADFQYIGLWIACCFVLQAWFAHKWLSQAGVGYWPALLASGLFVCAPLFLIRTYLHPALTAQWTLLAGFCLYGRPTFNSRRWLLLLVLTTLIHAYLLLMLAALWTADLVKRRWLQESSWKDIGLNAATTGLAVGLVMWATGYFYAVATITQSFHVYANLLAPLWPGVKGAWSSLISDHIGPISLAPLANLLVLNTQPAADEGFAYAGLGIILLAIAVVPTCLFIRKRAHGIDNKPSRWLFASAACLAMAIYAWGPHVYTGSTIAFSYPTSDVADRIYNVFRAAGRMIWPLWYLGLFGVICTLAYRLPRSWLVGLLSLAMLIQMADLWGMAKWNRHDLHQHEAWNPTLASPLWKLFATRYRRLVFMPNASVPQGILTWLPAYKELTNFAAQRGMSINSAYTARMDPVIYERQRSRRTSMLLAGQSEPNTMYVLEDDPLWNKLACSTPSPLTVGRVDGKQIIAPGWDRQAAMAAGMQLATCTLPH